MISIRPMVAADIATVAASAREADVVEMRDGAGLGIGQALSIGLRESLRSWVIECDGMPMAAAGDTLGGIGVGVPWMVTTQHIVRNRKGFLCASRAVLDDALTRHFQLVNYVDARNNAAIRWLSWLGFSIDDPVPYGAQGLPFHKFHLFRS